MGTISAVTERSTTAGAPDVHVAPPLTPSSLLRSQPGLLAGLGLLLAALAAAATVRNAQLLLVWDEPIQHWVQSRRTGTLDGYFRTASKLGSTIPVLTLGVLGAAVTWRRCRAVSTVLLVATFSRPPLEFLIKAVVDRERPTIDQMVPGNGPSFPSGHPMAAIALWGMLPVVVALYTQRRALWWASVAVAVALIGNIGASRVYLGVHWFSDVVAGLVIGAFFLLGVEAVLTRQHARHPCAAAETHARRGDPGEHIGGGHEVPTGDRTSGQA